MAEADGNRTRQTELLGLTGFEDRGAHQDPNASGDQPSRATMRARDEPAEESSRGWTRWVFSKWVARAVSLSDAAARLLVRQETLNG